MAIPFQPGQPEQFGQGPGFFFGLANRVAVLERQVFALNNEVDRLRRRLEDCCPRFRR